MTETTLSTRPVPGEHVPGEPGLWILVLGDLVVFGVLFCSFLAARNSGPAMFAQSRHELTVVVGVANTLILLTSSLLVAQLVQRHRGGDRSAGRFALGAIICGVAFVAVKLFEWTHLLVNGIGPGVNTFFTWYFVLTGLHLLHLLLGLTGLLVVRRVVVRLEPKSSDRVVVEGVATYWHMVDLLWLVIFPLVYLSAI